MDTNYFSQSDRRLTKERRPSAFTRSNSHPPVKDTTLSQEIGELMPVIAENTSRLVKEISRLATVSEMVMESQIRQQTALADFFESLSEFLANSPQIDGIPMATTSYACGTHYTKDDIISTINMMRDQGATFATIAEYLRDKGIPTFSGRGQWHAQTIHRLCKQN